MKEFADDNFKFDENGRKVSERVENTGKRRNCSSPAISSFPAVFSKNFNCRHVKTRACLEKGSGEQVCRSFLKSIDNKEMAVYKWFSHVFLKVRMAFMQIWIMLNK